MALPGQADFFLFLKFLDDRKAFEKHIKTLEQATEKNTESVELVGKAKNIQKLETKAGNDRGAAAQELEQAKVDAASTRDAARKSADKTIQNAAEKADAQLKAMEDREYQLTQLLEENQIRKTGLDHREAKIEKLEQAASMMLSQGNKLKEEFQTKRDALQGVLSQVN